MSFKPAIASMSLGRAWVHSFDVKMREAAKAGFKGVEIFYEDLEYIAKGYMKEQQKDTMPDEQALLSASRTIKKICDELGLEIIGLQPFLFYEGLIDREAHKVKIQKLKIWLKIVKILGTDIIQIPSNFQQNGISGDLDLIVADMQELADLGIQEQPPIRFAYENLAWATFVDTWEVLWAVVKKVNRPNFGCCLDTFNIAGRVWADPASESGKTENADETLKACLKSLVGTIDVEKVFYIQVVDGEKLGQPLVEGHPWYVEGQPARMSWSRNARVFLFEEDRGGYLPVVDVAKAFVKELKYCGWVSMELFSRTTSEPDDRVPHSHAQRGYSSWLKVVEELQIST